MKCGGNCVRKRWHVRIHLYLHWRLDRISSDLHLHGGARFYVPDLGRAVSLVMYPNLLLVDMAHIASGSASLHHVLCNSF